MVQSSYARSLKLVLQHEGGFSDHPRDPGGATNFGVTQRVYNGYRTRKGLTEQSVKKINKDEISAIYQQSYWNKVDGDELPAGLDYCVFDAAVNSGPSQAAKWLQRGVNDVLGAKTLVVDGNIGPATLAAAERAPIAAVIDAMCDRRLAMLKGLKTWSTFGDGWERRVSEVREKAKKF